MEILVKIGSFPQVGVKIKNLLKHVKTNSKGVILLMAQKSS